MALLNFTGKLTNFAPDEWFKDRANSSFWLRIYTSLITPHSEFQEKATNFISKVKSDKKLIVNFTQDSPIMFAFGTLSDMKVMVFAYNMYAKESGETVIDHKVDERVLKNTNYIFLAAPFRVDGSSGNEYLARRSFDIASGIICLHTGINFMHQISYEGEIHAKSGAMGNIGPPIKIPQPAEGPFLGEENGGDISEISNAVNKLKDNKKNRIALSLQLMDSAMRKDDGFLEYWTALEVICDGNTNKIKNRIAKIYDIKSHNEAAEKTGLNLLGQWRHDYVHKGIKPMISADIERYIQLLFLDLLRFEVGLKRRGHIAGVQSATGYNLSPIGLADNRTEEQKSKN